MPELKDYTSTLLIEIPAENSDPFWEGQKRGMEQVDLYTRNAWEESCLTLIGGGTMTLVVNLFTWSAPLLLISGRSNEVITIAAGNITITDGQIASITGVSRPIVTDTLGTFEMSSSGPAWDWTKIPVFRREGSNVYVVRNQIGLERLTLTPP